MATITHIWTPSQYAEFYHLHINTVQRLCREGKLPGAEKIGRSWRIKVKVS